LIGTGDAQLRLCLKNAGCGNANVVVLGQRRADQLLQLLVLKKVPPFRVRQ